MGQANGSSTPVSMPLLLEQSYWIVTEAEAVKLPLRHLEAPSSPVMLSFA